MAVGTPKVGSPKVRVSGRPRKAIATASPALAVRGPVSTSTGGIGRASGSGPHRSRVLAGRAALDPPRGPCAVRRDEGAHLAVAEEGPAEASGVHMSPPVLVRSATAPAAGARAVYVEDCGGAARR